MAVKRFSNSLISQSGQDKVTNFIAGYSPAVDEMDLIERVIVGSGGAANVTFSNIPQTYQHLQIRYCGRSMRPSLQTDSLVIRYNSDTTYTNYVPYHELYGNGSSALVAGQASIAGEARNYLANLTASGAAASVFAIGVANILDYSSISKNKTLFVIGGQDRNGGGIVEIISGLWINLNAITSITMTCASSNNISQHSTFSLYGIKA